jgi:FAD/FMN-containing dehydrogenase/Fe-S oxidoreductase
MITKQQAELRSDLESAIKGEVGFGLGDRALYATDASNYRQVPLGVVVPRTVDDLVGTVEVCRNHDVSLLPRGAGTSLAGQTCNTALVVDCSQYLRCIIELDPERRAARVEPGVILDSLRRAAEVHHLTFGPDPATHAWCTLGGMIGNNSCGVHSVMAGKTVDSVDELEIVTYDGLRLRVGPTSESEIDRIVASGGRLGEIYLGLRNIRDRYAELIRERYPQIPRRVSGYNLDSLLPENGFNVARALVGSEGTCVTILQASVRLVRSPPHRALLVLGYPDVALAADAVPQIVSAGCIGLEGLDQGLVDDIRRTGVRGIDLELLPPGGGWLLVEFGADSPEETAGQARALVRDLTRARRPHPSINLVTTVAEQLKLWSIREAALPATARPSDDIRTWDGWEDTSVPINMLGRYVRDFRELTAQFGYQCRLYGHFGDGCIHTRINFDFRTTDGVARYRRFVEAASDLVIAYGGSLSGEHGDGQSRGELLTRMFGPELVTAFRDFKSVWDPKNRMNPGKLVDARPLDSDLRLGPTYQPLALKTRFHFPADNGALASATERCVGVGKCRSLSGGVMCPSFRATLQEEHSTRGRARLLFEMSRGETLQRGWREASVRDSLDLCLSCKGCRSDCPVGVDVATYKAEFLHHYYARRIRPRFAYATAAVPWIAAVTSTTPRLANRLASTPGIARIAKAVAGISAERPLPKLASAPFTHWFADQAHHPTTTGKEVVLLPDTFTNRFSPEISIAAVRVLRAAGFRVTIPTVWVCCGRPLYDQGMLVLARRLLRRILRLLTPSIDAGVPLVVLEPSCAAVFRDEMPNMLRGDARADQLARNTFTLAEFLVRAGAVINPGLAGSSALVQTHCHQHAVMGFEDDLTILARLGLDARVLDQGCCGLAGAFGFERGRKYRLSMAIGELGVLPAIRSTCADTLILADGFSCREQIRHGTGRKALHLAQILDMQPAQPLGTDSSRRIGIEQLVEPAPDLFVGSSDS